MTVLADAYMGVFMPRDLPRRIIEFMAAKSEFPFITKNELIGLFYLFGWKEGVAEAEISQTSDLARRAVERVASDIRLYRSMPQRLDPAFTRQNYTKRSLQIVVDNAGDFTEVDRRVAGDPAILADCFAQHVAYYSQDFFFELFGPLKNELLPDYAKEKLQRRMVLIGYNAKDRNSISHKNSLDPFVDWLVGSTR